MKLRFTDEGPLNGRTNMACDADLLRRAELGEASCRVYGWDGIWVSLGRFQSPERDLVAPDATRWVIRPTGGKAVLHGHDVTVGFAVPIEMLRLETRSLREVYRKVVQPLVAALRGCGVSARLAEDTRHCGAGSRTADCFAFNSPNDVVDEGTGQKVCGCALRLTDAAVLVQASLPNGAPLAPPDTLIRNAALSSREWDSSGFSSCLEQAILAELNHSGEVAFSGYAPDGTSR